MNPTRLLVLILLLALGACSERTELLSGNGLVVLEHATIVDGTGAPPRDAGVVVLAGSRILRVGRLGQYRYPGATVVDLTGRWLVPGFMDLHAHIDVGGQPQPGDFNTRRAATLLAFGITTIRSPAAAREAGTDLRDRIASGSVLGPRMFTAGPLMDLPGGLWNNVPVAVGVKTVEDVRAEVRRQVAAGVDFVKFYAQLNPELVRAGLAEAHAVGVRAIGHLGATSWTDAARSGIDVLVHSGVIGASWQFLPREQQVRFREFYVPGSPHFDPPCLRPGEQLSTSMGPSWKLSFLRSWNIRSRSIPLS